jgi:hypothetical protein
MKTVQEQQSTWTWRYETSHQTMTKQISMAALLEILSKTVPLHLLVKPNKKNLNVTTCDYGGHELGLNYPYAQNINNRKIGDVRVRGVTNGLKYEGGFKGATNGRIR